MRTEGTHHDAAPPARVSPPPTSARPLTRVSRLRRVTASLLLPLYGYELLAAPFVMAAPAEPVSILTQERVASYLLYTRQGGETLGEIAQRFGVSEATLVDLQAQGASYGWSDRVWLVPKTLSGEATLYPGYLIRQLKTGETLASVALRYNRSERELTRLNAQLMGSAAVAQLKAGAHIVVPAPSASDAAAAPPRDLETQVAQTLSTSAQALNAPSGASSADALTQMAASRAGNALSQQAEDLLGHYGRAKIGVSTNTESHDVDVEFDYLHPLLDRPEGILFLQLGGRTFDSRSLGNVGLGYRHQLNDNLMLGTNAFIDQDLSRDHTRAGVGLEAWTNDVRLAANAYAPLSDWKRSDEQQLNTDPERFDLYERPASGWDARGELLVPGVPQLAATLKYFQWSGDGVDVFGGGELEKDPNGYAVGLRWQPIPLLGVNAEHQQIQGGDSQWQVGLSLNWSFDLNLASQLDSQRAIALQPLASARQDFVQREYNVVLDYKQKAKPQTLAFAFGATELTLQAPPLGAPSALTQASPPLQGVSPGAVVTYSLSSPAARSVAPVSIDANTGLITVPAGSSTQALTVTANEAVNGVVVASAHYALQVNETLDTNAPNAPTLSVTDRNANNQPEASGTTEAGNTVLVTWPDNSSSSVVADGSGQWTVEAPSVQPSGNVVAVSEDASGNRSAPASAPWANADAPVASNVLINGVVQVGQPLTGSYTYFDAQNDAEGASQLQWLRDGVAIAGANQATYTPVVSDEGHQLIFAVTPVAATGTETVGVQVQSAAQSIAPKPGSAPVASAVTVAPTGISDVRIVGQTLQASYSYSDADGDLQGASPQQWLRNGAPIGGATSETYTLVDSDNHQSLLFSVTPVAQTGTPKSGVPATSPVLEVVGNTDGFSTPDTTLRSWADADSYCRNLGQRLPTVVELQQLFLNATRSPAIGTYTLDMMDVQGWPLVEESVWSSDQNFVVSMTRGITAFSTLNHHITCTQ